MNTLQSGGKITVESPDENARQIIQNMQARQGSNVKIVRSKKGHFLGAVDLNDTNQHYISNMDQFDTALGIIKPYEQAMASDPRQAAQLGRKRNWKNRSAILNSVYLSQYPVTPEPESDDRRTIELLRQQRQGENRDFEQGPSRTRTENYLTSMGDASGQMPLAKGDPVTSMGTPRGKTPLAKGDPVTSMGTPRGKTPLAKGDPVTSMGTPRGQMPLAYKTDPVGHGSRKLSVYEPYDARAIAPPATPDTLQKAEDFMRERLKTDPGWTPPPRSDAGPTPINRGEPYVRLEDPTQEVAIEELSDPRVKLDLQEGVRTLGDTPMFVPNEKEKNLLEYHRDNLFNNKFLQNEDGTITTLYSITFEAQDGRTYMIPGYDSESKTILSFNDALERAKKIGLDNFPSYESRDKARQAEIELHKIIDLDMIKFERSAKRDMQAGGQVPQINQSGFIQGPGSPVSDSIPMKAEPGSFIVNAPATQMIGQNKLNAMTNNTSTAKNTKSSVDPQGINVSNGEFKVSKPDAERIGYDNLNRINDAGKPFVEQLDKRGYAEGGAVEEYFETTVRPEEFSESEKDDPKKYDEENKEYIAYEDTRGFITFGPGVRDYKNAKVGDRKSIQEVDKEAIKRWKQAVKSAKKILGSDTHNAVLPIAEMVYQMGEGKDPIGKKDQPNYKKGTGVRGFKNMLAAIAVGDSEKAYEEALDSKWHEQTKERAERVAERLKKSLRAAPEYLSNRGFVEEPTINAVPTEPAPEYLSNRGFVEEPVNLLDIPEDSSKPKIKKRPFISSGGSDVYPPTDITLPPDAQDVEEYNKFKETFYN